MWNINTGDILAFALCVILIPMLYFGYKVIKQILHPKKEHCEFKEPRFKIARKFIVTKNPRYKRHTK